MRRTLSLGLVLATCVATGVAACSSTPPPTPAPTVETPTWDPRKDQIDQAAAIWERQQPPGYAYTFDHAGPPGDGAAWRYRVSALEHDVEVQHLSGLAQPAGAEGRMAVDGLNPALECAGSDGRDVVDEALPRRFYFEARTKHHGRRSGPFGFGRVNQKFHLRFIGKTIPLS